MNSMKQESTFVNKPMVDDLKKYQSFIKKIIKEDLPKYNPTMKNILKVEQILSKYKEFSSKNQLAKKLDVAMRPPVLNVILNYLEKSNKIMFNNDGTISWIYASPKAITSWKKSVSL